MILRAFILVFVSFTLMIGCKKSGSNEDIFIPPTTEFTNKILLQDEVGDTLLYSQYTQDTGAIFTVLYSAFPYHAHINREPNSNFNELQLPFWFPTRWNMEHFQILVELRYFTWDEMNWDQFGNVQNVPPMKDFIERQRDSVNTSPHKVDIILIYKEEDDTFTNMHHEKEDWSIGRFDETLETVSVNLKEVELIELHGVQDDAYWEAIRLVFDAEGYLTTGIPHLDQNVDSLYIDGEFDIIVGAIGDRIYY